MNELSHDPAELIGNAEESSAITRESEGAGAPGRLHGNSAPMRAVKRLRADLLSHVGNKPSSVQLAMVEQACELRLRLAVMDEAFRRSGRRSAHATRDYLAWSNSYTRLLRQFGFKGATASGPTLAEYLATKARPPAMPPPEAG